jgi:hypothetical protein
MRRGLGPEAWNQHRDALSASMFFVQDPKDKNRAFSDVFSPETVFVFYDPTQDEEDKRYVVIRGHKHLPWNVVQYLGSPVGYSMLVTGRDGKESSLTKPAVLVSQEKEDVVVCVDVQPRLVGENGSARFYICNPQLPQHVRSITFRDTDRLETLLEDEHCLYLYSKDVTRITPREVAAVRRAYGLSEPTSQSASGTQ